jgi:hypothetical protein
MDLFGLNGADFSDDRKYRYALWRVWSQERKKVMIIGLNPSLANESVDDPTIRRVKQLAASWGFGGIYMLNLFAWITPYPNELEACQDPVGDNNEKLIKYSSLCEEVVFAWGANDTHGRDLKLVKMFPYAKCIDQNIDGSPKHPLYVKKDVKLITYNHSLISKDHSNSSKS